MPAPLRDPDMPTWSERICEAAVGKIITQVEDLQADVRELRAAAAEQEQAIEAVALDGDVKLEMKSDSICSSIGRLDATVVKNKIYVDTLSSGPITFGARETSNLKYRMDEKDKHNRRLEIELAALKMLVQTQLGLKWPVHQPSDGEYVMPGFTVPDGFVLKMCRAAE